MAHQVIKYKCSYCGRLFDREKQANTHEEKCFYNEDVKSCITCLYKSDINEDGMKFCNLMNTQIFQRGISIRNCEGWRHFDDVDFENE